jgi:hypothetical protein
MGNCRFWLEISLLFPNEISAEIEMDREREREWEREIDSE